MKEQCELPTVKKMHIQNYADDISLHLNLCSQNWSMTNAQILPVRINGRKEFSLVQTHKHRYLQEYPPAFRFVHPK